MSSNDKSNLILAITLTRPRFTSVYTKSLLEKFYDTHKTGIIRFTTIEKYSTHGTIFGVGILSMELFHCIECII